MNRDDIDALLQYYLLRQSRVQCVSHGPTMLYLMSILGGDGKLDPLCKRALAAVKDAY